MAHIDPVIRELQEVRNLLKVEKEEDYRLYHQALAGTSLHDRRKAGICWYPVTLDQSRFDQGERLIIKLSRPAEHRESHSFQSGKPVALFLNADGHASDSMTVNGVVNQVGERDMVVTLQYDELPDWLGQGKLGVQLLFDETSYAEMERAMRVVIESEDPDVVRLRRVLLGDGVAGSNPWNMVTSPLLNESQNRALQNVLNATDVAIIHGPPGTGKTTTLVQAIIHTLCHDEQVLVCAAGNVAVDLLVEKLAAEGVDVVRVGHPARVTPQVLEHTLDARVASHASFKELKYVKRRAQEVREQALKFKRNFGPQEREQRRQLFAEADALRDEAGQLSFYITNDVLSHARVVACTLVGASQQVLRGSRFKTLFIDEAAQALEPACWIPILKAKRVIFAGDHCQLPPTIKSQKAAKGGLETTLFEKAIARNHADVMLEHQYRMNETIMAFPSKYFYKGLLMADVSVANHRIYPDDVPLEFVDTAGCGYAEEVLHHPPGIVNSDEAALVVRHLLQYAEMVSMAGVAPGEVSWAVISPYKAQTTLLRQLLDGSELMPSGALAVNTVDSFQGQERDVVYISLARSNDEGIIGFLADIRRMNVAMTRARKKLVIVGDSATMGSHPFYSQLLDYIEQIGAYRSAWEWMG
ncbi:AAA domain-containing protein [Breznakibacter xylanolyticus]|uniref:AAA domain-containing protein n=1 Tax=Breznakibacter xylanolyticus TaxID=990 RepID=A0A2W7N1I2_9BACT|nr:AAA domain-containing protein [Breznakibacter xylanolyticus]PZX12217.1 AAA domain-containing protein [Breznakibacter xylanolyticus]